MVDTSAMLLEITLISYCSMLILRTKVFLQGHAWVGNLLTRIVLWSGVSFECEKWWTISVVDSNKRMPTVFFCDINRSLVFRFTLMHYCTEPVYDTWAATWQNQQNEWAPSEDSDQPGHPPSLIRVFAVCMKKAWVLSLATHKAQSEDSDQTGRKPRLIWVFAGRTLILLVVSCRGSRVTWQMRQNSSESLIIKVLSHCGIRTQMNRM